MKETIEHLLQMVINQANSELGTADEIIVSIPNTSISIVENQIHRRGHKLRDNNIEGKKQSSIEECLTATGLDRIVKEYITNDKKADIKKYHVNDIVKTYLNTNVVSLNLESQRILIDKILKNRNWINIRNNEDSY